jgi:hypothetical protein
VASRRRGGGSGSDASDGGSESDGAAPGGEASLAGRVWQADHITEVRDNRGWKKKVRKLRAVGVP